MINYLTNLRAFAILAVIMIHTSAPLLNEFPSKSWWFGNIIDSSVRWSVPIFVMVSGALLLGKDEALSTFFKKRFLKVGIPFVFWVSFYILFNYRHHLDTLTITSFLKEFFSGQPYFHLWFLYMIIGLYLLTPVFRKITKPENKSVMLYFIILWVIISTVIPTIGHYLHYQVGFHFYFFTGFSGLFLMGYYLHVYHLSKIVKYSIYVLAIGSWLFTIVATYYSSRYFNHFDQFWYEYMGFNTVIISVALFIFFKDYLKKWDARLINLISKMSFGIYLIHPIFLALFTSHLFYSVFNLHLNCFYVNPIIGTMATFIVVVMSSSIMCYFLQKIKILNRVLP